MLMTAPFPYSIEPELARRNPTCVFKLVFGTTKKYFIFKGMRVANTVETLANQIYKENQKPKEDSILFKVVSYIKASRPSIMTVEVIKETDDTIDLLMTEFEALKAAKKDPNCLNTRFYNNEYFPKWIPQSAINQYNKILGGGRVTDKEKNFRKFLQRLINGDEAIDLILKYVKKKYH